MNDPTGALRHPAEVETRAELDALAASDAHPRPPGWRLSPRAVLTYLIGGRAGDLEIAPKYLGPRRLIETAVATLATDRALLLLGVPGTAKTWVAEHLAAAISGDSTLIVQGTAGTTEEQLRHGWNYAALLQRGPTREALVPGPVMRAMSEGRVVRIEELTRIPGDVQDALIGLLSEKAMPLPELGETVRARAGFNLIATANDRDRGVNELSAALRRRFNVVVLPTPATEAEELEIVRRRVEALARALALPAAPPSSEALRQVVITLRELREGRTADGRTRLRTPATPPGPAEAIAIVTQGMALAAHFGTGRLEAADLAPGLHAAVVRDPQDRAVWQEYVEGVMRGREGWQALFRACRDLG